MALVFKDRCKESTTTTGTGTYTLGGTYPGYQAFSAVGDGNTVHYCCTDGTDWETGLGTYTLAGTTLARTTIYDSSNGGAAVNWGAGAKVIFEPPLAKFATDFYTRVLNDITDVTITAVQTDDVLKWNGSAWVNGTIATASAINDLTDVVITTPADNEVLAYDTGSGDWINQTPAEAGLAGLAVANTFSAGQTIAADGGPHLKIKDSVDSGNAAVAYIQFLDSLDAIQGQIGTLSPGNNSLYVNPGTGGKLILDSGALGVLVGKTSTLGNGDVLEVAGTASIRTTGVDNFLEMGVSAAGYYNMIRSRNNGLNRWVWGVNSNAESGGNVGSEFDIYRYADNGSYLDMPMRIWRDDGEINFYHRVVFLSTDNDYGIVINGNGTTWAGINFTDVNGTDYLWYNGQNSTFSIGGGGANVAGKKLHVDGAVSIGSTADAQSVDTNGLWVQGGITFGTYIDGPVYANDDTGLMLSMVDARMHASSSETGYIKIALPSTWTNSMLRFTVKVYQYATNESFELMCGGYNYTTGAQWYNTFAYILGNKNTDLNFTVRFGHDGSKCAIWIGESSTVWDYPQVFVTDVQVGYSGFALSTWYTGWAISVTQSLGTISGTVISATQLGRDAVYLGGYLPNQSSATNTVAVRDASADIHCRLLRSTYAEQASAPASTADIAFRNNNTSDNYVRFMTLAAFQSWSGCGVLANSNTWSNTNNFSQKAQFNKNVGASPTYSTGQVEFYCSDAGDVSVGFHRAGYTACQLRHSSDGLILSSTSRTGAATFYSYGNVTAYSDARLKRNVATITDALNKVNRLRGVEFERINEDPQNAGRRQIGVIAQEVLEIVPEVVDGSGEHYSVAYGNMVGLLIEAVKELSAKVEALENRI